jgi:hypothetical protein
MKHVKYLKYVVRHKWFVLVECWKRGFYWRGLAHDISKFLPSEWVPYVEYFCTNRRETEFWDLQAKYGCAELAPWGASVEDHFNFAWLLHQRRNPHHWQYWLLKQDDGPMFPLPMPHRYVVEMLCDWIGAGKAQGKPDTKAWYLKNRDRIILRDASRKWIERELGIEAARPEVQP